MNDSHSPGTRQNQGDAKFLETLAIFSFLVLCHEKPERERACTEEQVAMSYGPARPG
jgi:hypothetical protein